MHSEDVHRRGHAPYGVHHCTLATPRACRHVMLKRLGYTVYTYDSLQRVEPACTALLHQSANSIVRIASAE